MEGLEKLVADVGAIVDRYGFGRKLSLKDGERGSRCCVVGSNPSMLGLSLGKLVDGVDWKVIRVNRLPQPELYGDYGSASDLFFGCVWSSELLSEVEDGRKVLLEHPDILKASSAFYPKGDLLFTTGFMCALAALSRFDEVSLLGFGRSGVREGTDVYHSVNGNSGRVYHDVDVEHAALEEMAAGPFGGRLMRLEDGFREED